MTSVLRRAARWAPLQPYISLKPIVPVVPLEGVIGRIGPFRRGLTLAAVAPALERAFAVDGAVAVALTINSPGGSPVQSALIAKRIRALSAEKKLPVLAFAEDVAASGGYWLLCAGDEIYADASSIVGSIGVVSASFGFPKLMKKIGVERRVHTAGVHKSSLDPFRDESRDDVVHLRALQDEIHAVFCGYVRERRGERLKGAEGEVFSGRYWTGATAVDLGLIDGLGDVRSVLRGRFGDGVKMPVMGERKSWWRRRLPVGGRSLADDALAAAEERLLWAQFGL